MVSIKGRKYFLFLIGYILLTNCRNIGASFFEPEAIAERDSHIIKEYLKANNIAAKNTDSGLHYINWTTQNGERASVTDSLVVDYRGKVMYGNIFDDSYHRREKFGFRLTNTSLIEGWKEATQLMRVGDSTRFILPSHLGYGVTGDGKFVPPNAILIFDIKLHKIYP